MIIPNRFESILNSALFNDFKPLILPVESDLKKIQILNQKMRIQNGGVLAFILGRTGIGKTTLAHSIPVYLYSEFSQTIRIPDDIEFREVIKWLQLNLPEKTTKSIVLLFDGREITDDSVGLNQFLTGLNQLLRKRNDLLFLWPTNSMEWFKSVKEIAKTIGGSNFSPGNGDLEVAGVDKSNWRHILEKILIQIDISIEDFALSSETLDSFLSEDTLGEFLSKVGTELSNNVLELQQIKNLPKLIFVISSGEEVGGEANRIRKAKNFTLRGNELLSYSSQSESGKFWRTRGEDPKQKLAYIISLFEARLTTVSASVVTYACLHYGEAKLQSIPHLKKIQRNSANAKTTMKASDLYKFLTDTTTEELTSSKKGKTSEITIDSFSEIQKLSAKKHKEINKAVASLLSETLMTYDKGSEKFEVDGGSQNLYTDLVATVNGNEIYFEFHHLSIPKCNAASMSSYIMDKLRAYAFHFNLMPR